MEKSKFEGKIRNIGGNGRGDGLKSRLKIWGCRGQPNGENRGDKKSDNKSGGREFESRYPDIK